MPILKLFLGDKGTPGIDGINGLGPADVNAFDLEDPILDSLQPNKLSKNAFVTFERDQLATYVDRYGNDVWSDPTTATNYVDYSDDFTQWTDPSNEWTRIGSTTDPFGGNEATEINLDVDTDLSAFANPIIQRNENGWSTGKYIVISFYAKRISGTITGLDITTGSDKYDLNGISDDWERKFVKVAATGAGFLLGVNPRGKTGARFAVFRVQIEDTILTDGLKTVGSPVTVNFENLVSRRSDKGYLIEESKTNLIHNSNDLKFWSATNTEILNYTGADPFGFSNSPILITFPSLPDIELTTATDTLTNAVEYNVSFWVWVGGGSLNTLTFALGDGIPTAAPQPSVEKLTRVSIKVTAGTGNTITIRANSDPLTAQLYISNIQIETGEVSSYIEASLVGQSRLPDNVDMGYLYSVPKPSLPWSFIFGKNGILDDNSEKTIFSNGEAGANEFSLVYQDRLLILKSGVNTSSFDLFDYEKSALVYDGTDLKFYGEKTLLNTDTVGSTTFIGTNFYLGYNGTDKYFNGSLFTTMFYNVELSANEIIYLLGV